MTKINIRILTLVLLIFINGILVSGCFPGEAEQSGDETAIDLNAFRTEVASTVIAQLTNEAAKIVLPSDTPVIPTDTPEIIETATLEIMPTNTMPVIPTATTKKIVYPTFTPIPYTDSAIIVAKSPADGTSFGPNTDFDIRWTIKNTGRRAWNPQFYYRYSSGVQGKTGSLYYVGGNLNVGEHRDLIVDMIAPSQPGTYNTYWQLINDDGVVILTLSLVFFVN